MLVAAASPGARADGYGELSRFSAAAGGLQFSEQSSAFGVDPTDNNVYVGEEVAPATPGEASGKYRVLRFSSSGALLAQSPVVLKPKTKSPLGIEGVAVDPALHRVYVLGRFQRGEGEKVLDPGEPAAGTLYALNSETLKSEVPGIEREQEEGVLANPKALVADKPAGGALLNPHGIAVDPTTHEVVMLGELDTGTLAAAQRHLAFERVSSGGALLPGPYVDPAAELEPPEVDSPVVTAEGDVLAERVLPNELEQIIEFPRGGGSPSVAFEFPPKTSGPASATVSEEELLEASSEFPDKGAGLALASEGQASGLLYSDSAVTEQALGPRGVEPKNVFAGAMLVDVKDAAGAVTTSERGWTGGANSLANPQAKCAIAAPEGAYPMLGAGGEGQLFVLDWDTAQVIEFGAGGEGCPHPSAPGVPAIELSDAEGQPLAEAPAGANVTLSTPVVGGNVVSSEWSFGDGTPPAISTAGEYQGTEVQHTFSAIGTYTVVEKILTDDLAAPELTVQATVSVKYATRITTLLESEGASGAALTVKEGAALKDQAALETENLAQASGTVTYTIYSDPVCSKPLALAENPETLAVSGGAVPRSQSRALPPGAHYWQASYSGDAAHMASTSKCATEIVQGPTTLTALLESEGAAAPSLTIKEGAAMIDRATVEGPNSAIATGTVEYKIYSDSACTKLVEGAGTAEVKGGSGGPSEAKKLAAGTYYWQAAYRGDSANRESFSACAAEVVQAPAAPATPGPAGAATPSASPNPGASAPSAPIGAVGVLAYRAGLAQTALSASAAGVVVVKVACLGTSSCSGTLTLRTLAAVRVAAGKPKTLLLLTRGSFALHGGQIKALTLRLTPSARKLLARLHVLRVRAVILARDAAGASHSTALIATLRSANKHH